MKRIVITLVFMAAFATALPAQNNPLITYAEGKAQVQDTLGKRRTAETGSLVVVDETLITGKGGRIQLKTRDGIFDIMENTVLKLMQAQKQGKKQNAYLCALGRVNMKVNRLASGDPGPRLGSSTAAAGVRGTELDIYAGADGSSLVVVTEGLVDVESQGATVGLTANEGVEVKPGQAPGAKITFKQPEDYQTWNQGKIDGFEKDPVGALVKIETLTKQYVEKIEALWKEYLDRWAAYENEWAKWKKMVDDQGEKSTLDYYNTIVQPAGNAAANIFMEIRYNSLSLLSLKRFIVGRMYLDIRTRYLGNENTSVYADFIKIYGNIVKLFDNEFSAERKFGILLPRESPFLEEGHI
jgi:hypothetical protein